ncbi:HAD family hydrolase [Nocardioides astragali]|uniref:HAD family hydrolase n=1 Tax=Nocardioides astragali TaxID=1776736 RepID=UPI00210B5D21|nr:HAD family hydrolase [Nocardioides astragali]
MCDVDGTLLTSDHRVTARTLEAVAAAQALGVEVMLASSRAPGALRPVVEALDDGPSAVGGAVVGASPPFISSQGALLGCYVNGELEVLGHRPAPLDAAHAMIAAAYANQVSIGWYRLDDWLVPELNDAIEREATITHTQPTVIALRDLIEQTRRSGGPDKLMFISDLDAIDRLEALAAGMPAGLQAQFSNPNYLEITAAGVDKGSTLRAHLTTQGLTRSEVLCVGDGPNDLGMFAIAGLTAAPANARPQVLAAADLAVTANDEDGIARLLELLIQIHTASTLAQRPAGDDHDRRHSQHARANDGRRPLPR